MRVPVPCGHSRSAVARWHLNGKLNSRPMRILRPLGLIVCALLLVPFAGACSTAGGSTADGGQAASSPSAAASVAVASPSSAPADNRTGNQVPCKAFDDALLLVANPAANAAAPKKIIAVTQEYATAVDKAKAKAQDPDLASALGKEAEAARFMVNLWEKTGTGSDKLWTEYRIGLGKNITKHCFTEWLPNYERLQKAWLASLSG